ncbi:GNAT family N-acetyltransferase OS=Streptomyces alboniger OX=132473 GN=CP975_32795 PE=4 SV=1 [Streptomyces alboniger]
MSTPDEPRRRAIGLAPMTATHLAEVLALGRRVYDTSVKL